MTTLTSQAADLSAPVTLTVPAATPFASVARATAASLAVRAGADVDAIDDLRVAMSDAFAVLLDELPTTAPANVAPAVIDITLAITASGIAIRLSAPTRRTDPVPVDTIAWVVLDGLLDHLECSVTTQTPGRTLVITGRGRLSSTS